MRWIWQPALALAIIGCWSLARGASADGADASATPLGRHVAEFSLPDVHGKPRSLSEFPDKVVVLAFLGTECPLARTYVPRLRELAAEFESRGVIFLGIDANVQDSLAEIGNFARSFGIAFPILKDNNNVVADRLGAMRTPEVFVLDRQHTIRYWGRIDDQYGFRGNSGYARPTLTQRYLAQALGQVLDGKPVTQPMAKADGCFIGRVAKTEPHGEMTYSKQIARIFQNRCQECHRAGEVAPFAMETYDDVIGWAETIREVIQEGRMPPWFADPKVGHFQNDGRLSAEETRQVCAWVENGCPQGDPQDLPEPSHFAAGWRMGEPDQVVYLGEKPTSLPAEGAPRYKIFTVDPGWTTDKWIQATESRPGNRSVVHHLRVYVRPPYVGDAAPPDGIGWYAPGFPPYICPPGVAIYVPANSQLEFWMHYTPNGAPAEDRSMIGIRFADPKTVKKMVVGPVIDYRNFTIPPGKPDFTVWADRRFAKDTLLLSLLPHMHLRGKSFQFEAEYPNGTTELLLDVPRYDFNWQLRYILSEPKLLPKGTRLIATGHFDNSADNPANPDPNKAVTWGQQTTDEMMEGLYTATDAGPDFACMALVALSLSSQTSNAGGPEASAAIKKLFDAGAESTPQAVAAARAQYDQLKASRPLDTRLEYAFGLVLAHQGQYRDAISSLSQYLELPVAEPHALLVKLWCLLETGRYTELLPDIQALAGRFPPRQTRVESEERQPQDKFRALARFVGVLMAYLEQARPQGIDAGQLAAVKKQVATRIGDMYEADLKAGEQSVRGRSPSDAAPGDAASGSASGGVGVLSAYHAFPYEAETQRVLGWYAR